MFNWGKKKKEDSFTLDSLKLVLQQDRDHYKNDVLRTHIEKAHTESNLKVEQRENQLLKEQLKEKDEELNKMFALLNDSLKENEKLTEKLSQKSKQIDYTENFKELKQILTQQQKVLADGSTITQTNIKSIEPIPLKLKTFESFVDELTEGQRDLLSLLIKSKSEISYNKIRSGFVKLGYKESSVGGFLEKLKKKGVEQFVQIVKDDNRVSFKAYDDYKMPGKEKKEKVGKKKEKKIASQYISNDMKLITIDPKKTNLKKKKVSPTPPSKKKKTNSSAKAENKKVSTNKPISKLARLKSSVNAQIRV